MNTNISEKKSLSEKEQLKIMIENYLDSNPMRRNDRKVNEIEIRFGSNTKKYKPISKIDYDNVVQTLYTFGFTTTNPNGMHSLRINNEYTNKSGGQVMSNIRAEIVGIDLIQEYCNSNSIQKILDMNSSTLDKIQFTQKTKPVLPDNTIIQPVDFKDFNLRISYQLEQSFTARSPMIGNIISSWTNSLKTFRHLNRVRFSHSELPIFADISIIRKSISKNDIPIKKYTIQEAGVFENVEKYEIEMELDNSRIGIGSKYNTVEKIIEVIRKSIRIILTGLQGTNYPVPYSEMDNVLLNYMKLLYGDEYQPRKILSKDFIGPSSLTLQIQNIMNKNEHSNVANIRKHYTVTDKADGDRKLLYINEMGKIYLIDTNMNVLFTGTETKNKDLFNSLLDGEHIKHNKKGEFINLYAAFDIYYINKKSIREFAFVMSMENDEPELESGEIVEEDKIVEKTDKLIKTNEKKTPKYRLNLLKQFIDLIKPNSIVSSTSSDNISNAIACNFFIKCKNFKISSQNKNIFECCSEIMSDINDGTYLYNTDGLIFTPANTAVANNIIGKAGPLKKITWKESFKWKPSKFNTIDFLVSIKKDKSGKDEVHNIFQNGINLQSQNMAQYKTLVLMCGYSKKDHGYLNPFQDLISKNFSSDGNVDDESKYKPVKFQPTDPYDPNACYANIMVKESGNKELLMFSEEGDYIEDHMIVEFSYDITQPEGFKWKPLRVRYDKTAELRSNSNSGNFGNAYHVANDNWKSIHNPITLDMITNEQYIPEFIEEIKEINDETTEANEDVYYNRTGNENRTKALRDFHNLFVKRKLIMGVSNRNDILIDYAVGKGGDLPKWINSNLSFVLGIDISKDNIHNSKDGACVRYLDTRKTNKNMPYAIFINGNSSLNIRNGNSFATEKDKQIAKAIFGNGPKDQTILGKGVYDEYGVATSGFNISSCQFALHYFLNSSNSFHHFLQNLSECTKLNGYFIGTCYDGASIFKLLKNKNQGESMVIMSGKQKIFELIKQYSQTGFPDDENSIGYKIDVYQETINKTFTEFLVNFNYLKQIMEDYGFVLISKEDAQNLGLPNGTGLFQEMYNYMETEIKQNPKRKTDYKNAYLMTTEERQISFLNRYFVFRKVRNVNAEKISKLINVMDKDNDLELEKTNTEPENKVIIRKLKGKKITIKANDKQEPIKIPLPVIEQPVGLEMETTTIVPQEKVKIIRKKNKIIN
jgi:hypothetical protein